MDRTTVQAGIVWDMLKGNSPFAETSMYRIELKLVLARTHLQPCARYISRPYQYTVRVSGQRRLDRMSTQSAVRTDQLPAVVRIYPQLKHRVFLIYSVGMLTTRQLSKQATSAWAQARKVPVVIATRRILAVIWQLLLPLLKNLFGKSLARAPAVPSLAVIDARCNRVKVEITCPSTSLFNDDEFEIAYACQPDDLEAEVAWSSLPTRSYSHRVIPQLSGNTRYLVRARSHNIKGYSSWGQPVAALTLLEPISGGASCEGYSWTQNGIETSIRIHIPSEVKAKNVSVTLRPEHLAVSYTLSGETVSMVEGVLPHRVRLLSPDGGSYWEIDREGDQAAVVVVLEKEKAAQTIKWGFWRSMFVDHPEIDTHAIPSDPYVKPIQPSPGTPGAPGLDMKTVARSEYEALRQRLGHSTPQI